MNSNLQSAATSRRGQGRPSLSRAMMIALITRPSRPSFLSAVTTEPGCRRRGQIESKRHQTPISASRKVPGGRDNFRAEWLKKPGFEQTCHATGQHVVLTRGSLAGGMCTLLRRNPNVNAGKQKRSTRRREMPYQAANSNRKMWWA